MLEKKSRRMSGRSPHPTALSLGMSGHQPIWHCDCLTNLPITIRHGTTCVGTLILGCLTKTFLNWKLQALRVRDQSFSVNFMSDLNRTFRSWACSWLLLAQPLGRIGIDTRFPDGHFTPFCQVKATKTLWNWYLYR